MNYVKALENFFRESTVTSGVGQIKSKISINSYLVEDTCGNTLVMSSPVGYDENVWVMFEGSTITGKTNPPEDYIEYYIF